MTKAGVIRLVGVILLIAGIAIPLVQTITGMLDSFNQQHQSPDQLADAIGKSMLLMSYALPVAVVGLVLCVIPAFINTDHDRDDE